MWVPLVDGYHWLMSATCWYVPLVDECHWLMSWWVPLVYECHWLMGATGWWVPLVDGCHWLMGATGWWVPLVDGCHWFYLPFLSTWVHPRLLRLVLVAQSLESVLSFVYHCLSFCLCSFFWSLYCLGFDLRFLRNPFCIYKHFCSRNIWLLM
jgi:hypothetical protein